MPEQPGDSFLRDLPLPRSCQFITTLGKNIRESRSGTKVEKLKKRSEREGGREERMGEMEGMVAKEKE